MAVSIRFLQAHHGDCILITVQLGDVTQRILVDGGPARTFKPRSNTETRDGDLKKVLTSLRGEGHGIDLVILTHIDDDHIGGLITAFEAPDLLQTMAKRVIFNSGRSIHKYFHAPVDPAKDLTGNFSRCQNTSVTQGQTLEDFLVDKEIWQQEIVMRSSKHLLSNCSLIFLTPDESELRKLLGKWTKEAGQQETAGAATDWHCTYEQLRAGDAFKSDSSIPNGSSLSFILNVEGAAYLFLGDAHPGSVIKGLESLGYTKSNPLRARLVKVSHHGSKGNTSTELLESVLSDHFVISANGLSHGLPDKATLARIHTVHPAATIHFNYVNLPKKIYSEAELHSMGEKVNALQGDMSFE
ncbi:ComEC/Rec2 family competence protein [Pseudomonas sp. LT1P18]|uniref:ComEC/Rec2 family competence protein n=1 Tax=Pseudomonas arabinosi TaxID=3398357 RepID=UPI0039F131A1